jgi:eukaryotic-like serine/threonine-protein kinase
MTLARGTRLGPYELTDRIGAGGMGEVWRAVDTSLGRLVAIKVLPDTFQHDPERLARFEREARALAALNHPNLATVYGLVDAGGQRAIVMELVEGRTLADRIAVGAIPYEEALPLARQLAEALEAAHEQGIVHRDLKPANVMVRADDTVKVLDFGLAKMLDPAEPSANVSESPTITSPAMTKRGVILGTAAYMAPEQAKGRPADRRADIWAFGGTLFEMLTGTRAFQGDDVPDTLAAILSKEPDWQKLPAAASALRPLLQRCLTKDPKRRLQAIGDARIQVDELMHGSRESSRPSPAPSLSKLRRAAPAAVAALVASALTYALMMWGRPERAATGLQPVSRFEIAGQTLADSDFIRNVAISPDGRHIAVGDPRQGLTIRALDGIDSRELKGTDGAIQPFFSPDGQWIGFFQANSFKRVPTAGGVPITICEKLQARGASWDHDGSLVLATLTGELARIPAGSCEPIVLTRPDHSTGLLTRHWFPSVLPGGRGILFTAVAPNRAESGMIAVLDPSTEEQKTLIPGSQAQYIETGHLVYAAANTLRAVRFDLERLQVLGDPVTVVDALAMAFSGAAQYAVSRTGTLVYAEPRMQARSLVWVDRKGQESAIPAPPRAYIEPRVSPDGSRLAIVASDLEHDIWIWEFRRGTLTRLTSDPSRDQHPVWTADGGRVVFASLRSGAYNLYSQAADGTGTVERLTAGPNRHIPAFVLPNGTGVIGTEIVTNGDIVWFRPAPPPQDGSQAPSPLRAEPLIHTEAIEFSPDMSPNGRYIAYQSQEPGGPEIVVRPFPRTGDGWWQVSTNGGSRPRWAPNGRELFYLDQANRLTVVPVQTSGGAFVHENPATVLQTAYARPVENTHPYDVSPDGQRFLMIKEDAASAAAETGLIVVLNWFEELKAKAPQAAPP